MFLIQVIRILWILFCYVEGRGLLLLYRPKDISTDCALSENLRYDVSFGMGMSDTITLVLRTMPDTDYECVVEIVTDGSQDIYLLVVIRFPNSIGFNCLLNPNAFTVMKKKDCLRLCDEVKTRDVYSPFYVISVIGGRIRFRFSSNSSLNSDMKVDMYEVTATSARLKGKRSCNRINETVCEMNGETFCFTSGVVCDGIKNCGVTDWFDERKSDCSLPEEQLGYSPVIAMMGVLFCALLAATHILLQCLPALANSFFIFNANEDNRLCINPVFKIPDGRYTAGAVTKKNSIVPVFSSSSSDEQTEEQLQKDVIMQEFRNKSRLISTGAEPSNHDEKLSRRKTMTNVKAMMSKIQQRLKFVTNIRRNTTTKNDEPDKTFDA